MKPLRDFYKFPVRGGDVGIEVETEFAALAREPAVPGWAVHNEGSIRGIAREFVTEGPVAFAKKRQAIENLVAELTAHQVVKDSHRTSVHVHVNIGRISPVHTWTAAVLYWMVENLLFSYCGEERIGNLFCLRLCDAEGLLQDLKMDLDEDYPFKTLIKMENARYAGLNMHAIRKFGSLEFRGMRGVYDLETIDTWSTACYHLVNRAGLYDSPEHMMDEFFKMDKKQFLAQIFGAEFTSIITKQEEWRDMLEEGVMTVLPLAYHHDWKKWSMRMEKKRLSIEDKPKLHREDRELPHAGIRPRAQVRWDVADVIGINNE